MAEAAEIRRKCLYCDSTFRDNFNVRRHINSRHPEKAHDILRINCALCGLIYIRRKDDKPLVEMCEECKKRTDIAPPENYNFEDEEEFKIWKEKMEIDTSTRYLKSRRTYNTDNGATMAEFPCYRSTFLSPKSKRLKVEVVNHSKKVSTCPAKMICEFAPNGSVSVSFFSEHQGHSLDANKMFEKLQKKDPVKKERPQVPIGVDRSLDSSSFHSSESMSNDYFNSFNLEESLSDTYNSDIDLVFSQIENEGQITSSNKVWLSSFCTAVENLAENQGSPFTPMLARTPAKKVLRDNNIPEPSTYEAQTSNKMTEEERQSIIRMVLDDL